MASTFTDLGLELMATGENAGTWGTKTNANLSHIEQLTGGYNSQAVTDSGTPTALGSLVTTQLSIASLNGLGLTATSSVGEVVVLGYQDINIIGNTNYSDVDVVGETSYTDVTHVA